MEKEDRNVKLLKLQKNIPKYGISWDASSEKSNGEKEIKMVQCFASCNLKELYWLQLRKIKVHLEMKYRYV